MARADLLTKLVKAGIQGDKITLKKVVESIIAEERAKQHSVLADKLNELLNSSQSPPNNTNSGFLSNNHGSSFVYEILPKRRIQDLILSPSILELCSSFIEEHNRIDLLRSYNIEPRNRLLLIGPPGNGKTSLAEGIAEALMIPLLLVRYESIIGSYLGETAIRINRLFEYASTKNCVLFFDEFETLGKERGDIHETGEIKRVVSSLLLKIDDLPSHVIAIGATNHPELLDRAVWRRFQVRIKLCAPTKFELLKWWNTFEIRMDFSSKRHEKKFLQIFSRSNFSEIEEFGNTVYRYFVLNQPDKKISDILDRVLNQWVKITEAK